MGGRKRILNERKRILNERERILNGVGNTERERGREKEDIK